MDWQWLETHIFERRLTKDERFTLQAVIEQVEFTQGDRILMQNEPGGALYLLRSGSVSVEMEFGGETLHLTEVGEGAQLGDLSFVDAQGAGATLIARTRCTAYKLTRDALSRLYTYREDIAHELLVHTLKGMSGTIRAMNETQAAAMRYIRGQH